MRPTLQSRIALARTAAARWRDHYGDRLEELIRGRSDTFGEVAAKLDEFGPDPDPDAVDLALGNGSATRVTCDSCGEALERGVLLGSHSQDEYGPCTYCRACLVEGLRLIDSGDEDALELSLSAGHP